VSCYAEATETSPMIRSAPHLTRAGSVISYVSLKSFILVHSTVVSGNNVITFARDKYFGLVDTSQMGQDRNKPVPRKREASVAFLPTAHGTCFRGLGVVKSRIVDELLLSCTLYLVSVKSLLFIRRLTQKCFGTVVSRTAFFCSKVI
jgi:hypothetical protein